MHSNNNYNPFIKKQITIKKTNVFVACMMIIMCTNVFTSCNDPNDALNKQQISPNGTPTFPYAPNNSYEYIGYLHNEISDKIRLSLYTTYGTSNVPINQIYNCSMQELVNYNLYNSIQDAEQHIPFATINSIAIDSSFLLSESINNSDLSIDVKSYINDLFTDIYNLAEITNDFADFKTLIINKENIIKTSNLSTSDKELLLKTASVARYSTYYWLRYSNSNLTKKRSWWKWAALALADVAGTALSGGDVGTGVAASSLATTVVDWDEKPKGDPTPDTTKESQTTSK